LTIIETNKLIMRNWKFDDYLDFYLLNKNEFYKEMH